MIIPFTKRILTEVDKRLLLKLSYNMGWKAMRAISKYKKRLKKGEQFPAFLMISVTDQCNYNCQGCWVKIDNNSKGMDPETLNNIIESSKAKGSYFFGILGGEPLMHSHILNIIEKHHDCYFQVFTNGSLLSDEVAQKLRKLGNVTPLISIEGLEDVSDVRRGAKKVYERSMTGIEASTKNKLLTGVATSVCKSNFNDLVSEAFIKKCIDKGIHYLWYYIYRPVGSNPCPELALSQDEILELREFMVNARLKYPIMIIDTYWDDKGKALCPGAVGISHHINPHGDIELCPPIQFALDHVGDGKDIANIIDNSTFLKNLRSEIPKITQGCILLDDPNALVQLVESQNANDSSKREAALAELKQMTNLPGHHIPGKEIAEKSWMYRFAKRNWFFGFGVYG